MSAPDHDIEQDGPVQAPFEERYWRSAPPAQAAPQLDSAGLSAAEFRLLADNIPTPCWIANGDGYIVWYNRRWHDYCGTTPEQMEGWGWQAVHDPAILPAVMTRWQASIDTGEPFEMTFPLLGADGRFRPFLTRVQSVRDPGGTVIRWLGVNTEITAQTAAQEAARLAQQQQAAFAEEKAAVLGQLGEGVIVTDGEGRITFVNEAAERLHGVESLQVAPDDYSETYHLFTEEGQPYPPLELPLARAALRGETVLDARWRVRRPDGTEILAIGSARPLVIGGERCGGILTVRDDSDRHQAEQALRESETRYRTLFEAIEAGFCIVEMKFDERGRAVDYRMVEVNPAFERQTGLENAQGRWVSEIAPGLERHWFDLYGRVARTQEPIRFEHGADVLGERWFDVYAFPVAPAGANRVAILFNDISDRRRAEEALRESEARFRNIADHSPLMMWVTDATGYCTYLNRAWYEFTGQSVGEAEGFGWLDATHPDDKQKAEDEFLAANAEKRPFRVEYRLRHKDGAYRWAIDAASPRFEADGAYLGYVGSVIDIDERKRAEALRDALGRVLELAIQDTPLPDTLEALLLTVEEQSASGMIGSILLLDADGRHLRHGAAPHLPQAYNDAIDGIAIGPDIGSCGTAAHSKQPVFVSDVATDPRWADFRELAMSHGLRACWSIPILSGQSEVLGTFALYYQEPRSPLPADLELVDLVTRSASLIIERHRAGRALRELNETLEVRIEERTRELDRVWTISQDLFVICGLDDGLYRAMNPAWTDQLGYPADALVGMRFDALGHPADVEAAGRAVEAVARGEVVRDFDIRMRASDGSYHWYSWTAIPEGDVFYAAGRDVTERKQLEEQLRQAQKMETLGQLTGGVAHDFNNLLQIVTGNLEILRRNLPEDEVRLRRSADNAMRGAERAAILTQRLLAFARRQPLAPRPLSLNKLVAGMSELLHRTIGEAIEIETVLASGLWTVEADPNQLENAIINLAINARDAMPDGGKLTIETSNTNLDHGYSVQNTGVLPGQYVVICVSDTGIGMPIETLDRVFEPFFTTKDVGRGTGLGLSMVYGFVKQSGGHVKLYSEPGEGTTVKLYLPRMTGNVAEDREEDQQLAPEGTYEETILVCEDDDDVRAYSVEVLRELGYRVLEAHDGPSALRLLERQDGPVDLLFTDVVLPSGMTGDVLADQARAVRPELKVLFTTGYARNAIVHHGRLDPGVELITKPFSYADLAARIRDLLDRA